MVEFNFITASDIHISDSNPRARIDNYKAAILDKITQIRKACLKLNADAFLIAGDLFNFKNPTKNSHKLNQDLIKEFRQFSCPIYMIEGNHDLTANRLESLEEQPLGVLFADKTLHQLRNETLEKKGFKVSLVGIPYTENLDLESLTIPDKEGFIAQICLMHIYAGLKPETFFKERLYSYEELTRLSPDIFVLGHYHVYQGIYEEKGKYFINLGSISRGALTEDNINHHPQIGFIKISIDDTGAKSILAKSIKLKIKAANEVFDLAKKEEEKKENENIKAFVEKLAFETSKQSSDNELSIENILDSMNLTEDVKEKVFYYIQEAKLSKG